MKQIALVGKRGEGKFALVDDEDFDFLNQFRWYLDSDGYAHGRIDRSKPQKRYLSRMHRLILGLTDSKVIPDHWDRNRLNNQKSNLRICNQSDNSKNKVKLPGKSSKYIGVTWHKRDKQWQASCKINGKTVFIGLFRTEEQAAIAYNESIKQTGNQFYVLNEIAQPIQITIQSSA